MKKVLAFVVVAAALVPLSAQAGDRVGDSALGAVSGAIVAGPVGLVAGGIVGYTAGPAISCSWGLGGCRRHHHRHEARR
jgi:hypothetical protein